VILSKSGGKEVKYLLSRVARQGGQVEHRKAGHIKVTHPSGGIVFLPSTPSDRRSMLNTRAQLRRAGFTL
jgi:hypothetical protein